MGRSGDEAVRLLLIKGLLEVSWHHEWAGGITPLYSTEAETGEQEV